MDQTEHYYDIKSTQLDMIKDRGYLVPDHEEYIVDNMDNFRNYMNDLRNDDPRDKKSSDFWVKKGLDTRIVGNIDDLKKLHDKNYQDYPLTWQIYWNEDYTRLILIYYIYNEDIKASVPVSFVRYFSEFSEKLRNIKINGISIEISNILISNVAPSSDSNKSLKNIPRTQFFLEEDLTYNPIHHISNQKHILLTQEEVTQLLSELKMGKSQLPGMKLDYPIAKYYGFSVGDVVRIFRTERYVNTIADKSINYRVVNV